MATRIPAQRVPPIAFAHRGAKALERDNTIASFQLAAKLGATGIESDVWMTADGVPVLDHDGVVGRVRRKAISQFDRAELPEHIPSLDDYFDEVGTGLHLSLDIRVASSFDAVIAVARNADPTMLSRLWLCFDEPDTMQRWRAANDEVRIVDSTRYKRVTEGPERRASNLANWGIDALNMRQDDWSGGLTTMFHRFGVLAFAWDAQFERTLHSALDMGVDAVYSDHVDRMVDAMGHFYPESFVPNGTSPAERPSGGDT